MKQLRDFPRLVEVLTVIGLLFYGAQSWRFAHSLDSIGDEGAYLTKGYLFAQGEYRPFQEYGFWTNKAPLAFLIPGYIQLWFGPGLREARYFAIVAGILMLVGVWLAARHLGGKSWGAAAVWVFALASPQIMTYSEALSQGLVACMLAWMFALTLGEDRPLWQLVAGSALSILIVMTRQNMAVVPLMLVLYVFWQYGKQAGFWSLSTCALLFIGFHILYWPNILQLWAPWLPESLTPFLDDFRASMDYDKTYATFNPTVFSRLQSFVTGMYDSLFVFFGSAGALVLFPRREHWKSDARFKMAVFLGITFLVLFVMHTLASLFIRYCTYCFSGYQMFYITAGFFFTLVVLLNGPADSRLRRIFLLVVILLFAGILGLYFQQEWNAWLLDHVQFPRINRFLASGEFRWASLRDVMTYSLGMEPAVQRRLAPVLAGVFLGAALWFLLWAGHRFMVSNRRSGNDTLVNTVLSGCLLFAAVFPFSTTLPRIANLGQCSTHFLTYYERAGASLAQVIPPGSRLYWRASGNHLALMLYLKDVKIFPPQVHAGGGYVVGDTQQLPRMGMYNQELDTQWRDSADILAVWENFVSPDLLEFLQEGNYETIDYDMGELSQCEDALYVFRRTQ